MPKTIRASTEARRRRRERAEQIADAPGGHARVFAAALSDAGLAALCRAVETLEREHMPASVWTWPGACDEHGQLDPAGSFRRRPWSDHAGGRLQRGGPGRELAGVWDNTGGHAALLALARRTQRRPERVRNPSSQRRRS